DAALRVTQERFRDAAGVLVQEIQYSYDRAGNRTSRVVNGTSMSYSYGAGHRLLSASSTESTQNYTYNADGRVDSITRPGLIANLGYSFEGQLRSVQLSGTSIRYQYDSAGRRIQSTVNGQVRRFLRAASVNGAYENPQAVLDSSAN